MNIQDVQQLSSQMKEDKQFCEQISLPRVINKRSGLTNFNRTTVEIINTFLTCFPSHVCLVAHYGNTYDFPLLKAELETYFYILLESDAKFGNRKEI